MTDPQSFRPLLAHRAVKPILRPTFDILEDRLAPAGLPPAIISDGGGATAQVFVPENTTAVTTVAVSAPAEDLTYSIPGGPDAALFAIDATSGLLTFRNAPDFETPIDVGGDNTYDLTVAVSDGLSSDTQDLAVSVTAVDDRPPQIAQAGFRTLFPDTTGPQNNGQFGYAVAASADYYVVGMPLADQGAGGQGYGDFGVVYVYAASSGALVATLNNPTPGTNDQFGYAVAISGSTIVVGVPFDDTGGSDSGTAYVFNAATGALVATLANPSPASRDQFGFSVGISGTTVIVGANLDDAGVTDSGRAYLFNSATGSLIATLANPSPASSDQFGSSVAISESTAVVSSPRDGTSGTRSGQVYLFDPANGAFARTIIKTSPAANDSFGLAVAASGTNVVISASGDRAYVYDSATGSLVVPLVDPTPAAADSFGTSLAISGTKIVVGAAGNDTGIFNSGQAFVFDAASGALVATVANPSPGVNDGFGFSVAIAGTTVVVGTPLDDVATIDDGRAAAFDALTGSLIATLSNPSTPSGDSFGEAAAIAGNRIVVGAPWDDTAAISSGRAYLFDTLTGNRIAILANPSPNTDDRFGRGVAISSTVVVVAAYQEGASDSGEVYLFDPTTGAYRATIANPSPEANDYFGQMLVASDDFIVVSSPNDNTDAFGTGQVYVFDAMTGALLTTLHNPVPGINDAFGIDVAISGTTVVVGSYRSDIGATDTGRVYAFNALTGALLATIANPFPGADDHFGSSLALDGSILLVGVSSDDTSVVDSGQAYVFDVTTGALIATLVNPAPSSNVLFGFNVALSGSTAIVSAAYSGSGKAYVYDASTGLLLATFVSPTSNTVNAFGSAVSISGSTLLVASMQDNSAGSGEGAAFTFELRFVEENSTFVDVFTATDGDLPPSALTWSITGGTDGARFEIDPSTGELRFLEAPNYEAPTDANADNRYEVTIQVSDGSFTDSRALSVIVTNVAPTITSNGGGDTAAITIPENTFAVTTVTGLSLDTPSGSLTYSIVGGADAAKFQINVGGPGVLSLIAAPDFETPSDVGANNVFDVIVQVADGNVVDTQALAVTIADANDAPVIVEPYPFLPNPTQPINGRFGLSVAMSGNYYVVGMPLADVGGVVNVGQVLIYDATTHALIATVANPMPTTEDQFGAAVAISGSILVVGAALDDISGAVNGGRVFVFNATTGALLRTITNPTPQVNDNFGAVVAISGSTIVVGTPSDNTGGADSGQAYIYDLAGTLVATILNPSPATSDAFGGAVAIDGSTIVIGAPGDDTDAVDSGAVYLFNATGGAPISTLVNPAPGASVFFGQGVALSGNTIIVGAPGDDTGADNSGQAYLFRTDGSRYATLQNPSPAANDSFGRTVALSGIVAVVGAPADDAGATDSGQAYFFSTTDGALIKTLANPSPAASDSFGSALATFANSVIVGAFGDDTVNTNLGAAYLFGTFNVAENTTFVGGVRAADQDMPPQTLTYSIIGGADAAKFQVDNAGQLSFIAPPDFEAATDADGNNFYEVVVQVSDGVATSSATYTVVVTDAADLPAIASIAPPYGPSAGGILVTISGANFTGASAVTFGGVPASFTLLSDSQISATVPAHAPGTVDVVITTPVGLSVVNSPATAFTYLAAPVITSITPAIGPTAGGTVVIIIGDFFTNISSVTFGGISALDFQVNSATQITAISPSNAVLSTVEVVVVSPGGSGSLAGESDFTYASPTVTSIEVNGGPGVVLRDTGTVISLAGQSSVVKQILVTFNQAVTVASDAFTVTPRTTNVVFKGGAAASTAPVVTSVVMLSTTEYLVMFVDDHGLSAHHGGILNSGIYDLTTIASKVSADGETMTSDCVDSFFTMFGTVDVANSYSPAPLGDGLSNAFVDPGNLFQFSDAFGANSTTIDGAYDRIFDYNLDGCIDPCDLFAFSDSFGIDWVF